MMINVNKVVYYVMLAGMLSSTTLYLIGIVLVLASSLTPPASFNPGFVLSKLSIGDGYAILMLATIILILTPVSRVVAALAGFAVNRDFNYVVISTAVLVIIILGVVIALSGLSSPAR